MSDAPNAIFERVAELTELYLRDEISDDQLAELETLILESEEGTQAMRTVLKQAGTMRVVFNEQREFANRVGEVNRDEYLKLLQTLSPAEEPEAVHELGHLAVQDNPTKQDVVAAGRYLFDHYVTPRVVGTIAAAAVLLLGVVLTIVLVSGDSSTPDTAQLPDVPDATSPRPNPNRVVATVTDQVNAQWVNANGEGALPDRMLLAVNQRLTLTKGFAEITTNRGAKVLVQAPATIETTDSDNAIRLHRGKLVGICETPGSKGFVVHAPGVDVVDLGTRFGVEADATKGTSVLVMEGSVRAEPSRESPLAFEPVVLLQNDARRVEPETGGLQQVARSETPVFYDRVPHPYVAAVLSADPVAYWRFEDDTNKTIISEVGGDRHSLRAVGPAALTRDGVIGQAGRLSNRAEPYGYFETASPIDAFDGLENFTIELWYYTDERYGLSEKNSIGTVFVAYGSSQDNTPRVSVAIELNDDTWLNRISAQTPPGWRKHAIRFYPLQAPATGERREIYTAQDYPVGRWQHLVLVRDRDGLSVYLDGELAERTADTTQLVGPVAVRLGHSIFHLMTQEAATLNPDDHRPLRGRLDEVALYDKPLTAEQVAAHFALATGSEDAP